MIIIILAAGRGNRLRNTLPKSIPYKTKSLIPINNEPAIKRLINQFLQIKQTDILLVLGHQYESVLKAFNGKKQNFVLNNNFDSDSNLRSLYLALRRIINKGIFDIDQGVLVIEADSFFSSDLLETFLKHINLLDHPKNIQNKICWTTKGYANPRDSGGFIDTFENISYKKYGDVKNIYIKTNPNSARTMKLYGITWFNNSAAIDWYLKAELLLRRKSSRDLTGYFHEIIFKNFNNFCNSYYDLGTNALSFNDYEEYSKCLDLKKF